MKVGRYVELTWNDVMAAVYEKHGGSAQGTWFQRGFLPPSATNVDIVRIQVIDPHEPSEDCDCGDCIRAYIQKCEER